MRIHSFVDLIIALVIINLVSIVIVISVTTILPQLSVLLRVPM